jgi:hypothetical protein
MRRKADELKDIAAQVAEALKITPVSVTTWIDSAMIERLSAAGFALCEDRCDLGGCGGAYLANLLDRAAADDREALRGAIARLLLPSTASVRETAFEIDSTLGNLELELVSIRVAELW